MVEALGGGFGSLEDGQELGAIDAGDVENVCGFGEVQRNGRGGWGRGVGLGAHIW